MDREFPTTEGQALSRSPRSAGRLRRSPLYNPRTWLLVLLVALGCYRFSLIGRGHFFWGDERRYLSAEAVVDDWSAGNVRAGLRHLYECYARPGFILASTVPVAAQRVLGGWVGIGRDTLQSYDIASGFNVLISLAVTCCFYYLARAWLGCGWYALLAALVYSLLCNTNVWIRHLMPYNQSLLMFLLALLILSRSSRRDPSGALRGLTAGGLSAIGFASYPTYYLFVVINAVVLLAVARRRVRAAAAFCAGSLAVVGAFELLAQLGGTSYIQELLASMAEHAGQKDQGYGPESYVFAWRYLRDVEGAVGVILAPLFAGFAGLLLWRRKATMGRAQRTAIAVAIGCYLLHATAGFVAHKTIFFGRILGMYLPFLVFGAVGVLIHVRRPIVRRVGVCTLLAASVCSFGAFAFSYARVVYPPDLLFDTLVARGYEQGLPPNVLWGYVGGAPDSIEELDPEFVMVADARPEGTESRLVHLASHEEARASGARFIGVNLKWVFYHRQRDTRFTPPEGYQLIAEALGPLAFPATGYEAYKPWERKRLMRRRYTMRVYERLPLPHGPPLDGGLAGDRLSSRTGTP